MTTLYSSAIFIGWGCVALLVVIERIYKNGIPLALAAVTGALTLILAVNLLEKQEDTLKPLQAVLDTNFWLATHVTCVSLGYTATLAAGCIGLAYVVLGVFTPWLNRRWSQETETVLPEEDGAKRTAPGNPWLDRVLGKALIQMLYGVFCFATLLSFTGTVLGGIWADQSWGRFWGWDPKENGAVLVVIMNALILHARWAGIIRDRGMAVLAVAGNMVVVWSWFGTNQLRIGLHSYGFNSDLVLLCRYVWTAHLAFLAIGLLPLKYWRSFRPTASSKPPRATRRKPVAVAS